MSSFLYDRIIDIELRTAELEDLNLKTIVTRRETPVTELPNIDLSDYISVEQRPNIPASVGGHPDAPEFTVIYARPYDYKKDFRLATGTSYFVKDMDTFLRTGRAGDGHGKALKVGDTVHLTEYADGTVHWSVAEASREKFKESWKTMIIVDPYVEQAEKEKAIPPTSVKIECKKTGMKPDITLDVNRIPGELCYKLVLKVRNLGIDDIDIRKWTQVIVTAGYLNGPKQRFACSIFSSYIESPSPDGVTVFECLTVGTTKSIIDATNICLNLDTAHTVRELIDGVSQAISSSQLDVINQLADAVNDIAFESWTSTSKSFTNIYALATWLQTELNDAAQIVTLDGTIDGNPHPKILVQIYRNHMNIFATNMDNKITLLAQSTATYLQAVSGVTFNGTACTVEAPWVPDLEPGGLFYLTPTYRRGSLLPNMFDKELFNPRDNLYRVITMHISFSTCGSENKMSIFAMPESTGIRAFDKKLDRATQEEIERATPAGTTVDSQVNISGSPTGSSFKRVSDVKDATDHMFKVPIIGVMSATDLTVVGDPSDPQFTGACYSDIADNVYGKKGLNLKPLYLDEDDLTKEAKGASTHVIYPAALWPIICIATKQMYDLMGPGNRYLNINMDDFETLFDGSVLRVPLPTSFKDLVSVKEIFYYVYQIYLRLQAEKGIGVSWLAQWKDLVVYLGGPEIED